MLKLEKDRHSDVGRNLLIVRTQNLNFLNIESLRSGDTDLRRYDGKRLRFLDGEIIVKM